MSKIATFLTNFVLAAFRHIGSIAVSVILIIVGAVWSEVCLYIGLFLLVSNVIVALVSASSMQRIMNYRCEDDPEFNEMMDKLSADPKAFLSEILEAQEENKLLHGEDLLILSDEDLFETVYFQNLDIAEGAADDDEEIELFTGARKVVYVLSVFDAEMQNGGLCQFFVNFSRTVAPCVSESLKNVNANADIPSRRNGLILIPLIPNTTSCPPYKKKWLHILRKI